MCGFFSLNFLFWLLFQNLVHSLNVLLQAPQTLLCVLQDIIILAHREPDVVLSKVRILIRVELGGRDRRDTHLLDQEPRQLEVPGSRRDVRRKGVVLRELDLGHVDQDKVAALGLRVRHAQLVPDLVEAVHLALHVADRLVPEALGLGLLEADGAGLLERGDGREADAGVRRGDVLDEVRGAEQPPHAPAGRVEILAGGAHRDGQPLDLGGQRRHPRKGDVVEPVVDFVGQDNDLMLDAEVTNALQLLL